jgi:hypothetical protein
MPPSAATGIPNTGPSGGGQLAQSVYALSIGIPGRRHWADTSEQAERLRLGAPDDTGRDPERHQLV